MTINDVGTPPVSPTDPAESADADLVLRSRSGDADAYAELWRRHYQSGVTVARAVSSSFDPDDLVQEAFTRIYGSIIRGGGPTGSFRAYLFTSIRNTAASWGRARRETAVDALDTLEDPSTTEQSTSDALDRGLTHQAFRSLPSRWQEVLWYSEIEQMKPADIAPLLGMKPTAVAQLTFRAREGLREAWVQAHLRSVADGSDCQWTVDHLGAYARLNIGRRDRAKVEAHLGDCTRCSIVASEAHEVSGRLALVLLPLALGAAGATGFLASLHGAAPAAALAAMPASVTHGAVTVTSVSHAAAVASASGGTGAAATAGASASLGAAASASLGAGTAASVGAGTTAATASTAAVAGASAAATAGAPAAAAGATAALSGAATAGTAVAATAGAAAGGILSSMSVMAGLATAGIVVVTGVIGGAVGLPVVAASNTADDSGTSMVQELGSETSRSVTTGDQSKTGQGVKDSGSLKTDTTDTSGAAGQTDTSAGAAQTAQPTPQPSPAGPTQAGRSDPTPPPGQTKLPTPTPTPSVLASDTLAIAGSTSYTLADAPGTTISVTVTGVPGATVAMRIRGTVVTTAVIGDDGMATLVVHPSDKDLASDARVDIRYVDARVTGAPLITHLSALL